MLEMPISINQEQLIIMMGAWKVVLERNEITYFQKLPSGMDSPIQTPYFAKESYQEAVKILNTPLPPKKWAKK